MTAADPQPPQMIPPGDYIVDRNGVIVEGPYAGQRVMLPWRMRVHVEHDVDGKLVHPQATPLAAPGPPPAGPTMRCYPVDGGRRWAVALRSAAGRLETLAALFRTEEAAKAYVARCNEALAARQRRLGPPPQPKGAKA